MILQVHCKRDFMGTSFVRTGIWTLDFQFANSCQGIDSIRYIFFNIAIIEKLKQFPWLNWNDVINKFCSEIRLQKKSIFVRVVEILKTRETIFSFNEETFSFRPPQRCVRMEWKEEQDKRLRDCVCVCARVRVCVCVCVCVRDVVREIGQRE